MVDLAGLGNGALDKAEWVADNFNAAPSQHRFNSALGLTAGLVFGQQIWNALIGAQPVERTFVVLQPLHGILRRAPFDFDPHGEQTHDRLIKVTGLAFISICGAIGTYTGSKMFCQKFVDATNEKVLPALKALDPLNVPLDPLFADSKIRREISEGVVPLQAGLANGGATGVYAGPTLGLAQGWRFMYGSGRRPAILGELLTGAGTSENREAAGLREEIKQILLHHTDENSEFRRLHKKVESMVEQLFFKEIPKETRKEAAQGLVRDFLDLYHQFHGEDGSITEEGKKALAANFDKMAYGPALEQLFEKHGLNPEKITLGGGGLIRWVGEGVLKLMGKTSTIAQVQDTYINGYKARLNAGEAAPSL